MKSTQDSLSVTLPPASSQSLTVEALGCAEHADHNDEKFDLLEHQVKQIFRDMNIPVLPSQLIHSAPDLKKLALDYPVVLKAQVHAGNRKAEGGIRKVTNRIDAIANAHSLFDSAIQGEYPEYLLAEAFYPISHSIGISMQLNPSLGIYRVKAWHHSADSNPSVSDQSVIREDIETSSANLEAIGSAKLQVIAQQLSQSLQLQPLHQEAFHQMFEQMYGLMTGLDLEFLEIDPLALGSEGQIIAIDGKVRFTAAALAQQPQLKKLFSPKPEVEAPIVQLEGNIGVLSNGIGLAMATVESIKQAGGKAAAFVSLKETTSKVARQSLSLSRKQHRQQENVGRALEGLSRLRDVKLILINWTALANSCQDIAETIAEYFYTASQHIHLRGMRQPVPIVVYLSGPEAEAGRQLLQDMGIFAVDSLEEAIAQGIGLAKMRSLS